MKKVLFICNLNIQRSRTAEDIFKDRFDTRSAGLFNKQPVTLEELEWADAVLVMERFQVEEIKDRFPTLEKPVYCMDIPDIYIYMDTTLVQLLQEKIKKIPLENS